MTDEKKPPEDQDEAEWDQALSEWDSKVFVPEVAKDVVTERPAALSGAGARPLYRPPAVPGGKQQQPPERVAPGAPRVEEDDENATVITAIPAELLALREGDAPSRSTSRGGLGQLFAREEMRDDAVEVRLDESQAKVIVAAQKFDASEEVVTSAKATVLAAPASAVAPLRRPPKQPAPEQVPDGAMFDPFAESRPEQATRPDEEEFLDELLEATGEPAASPDDDTLIRGTLRPEGPPLLAPDERRFDPNDETVIADRTGVEPAAAGPARTSPPARQWREEKPATEWLSATARAALTARASWLEEEARELADKVACARGLLFCSELLATLGDRERAHALAAEARDLAPSLALAHRQVRGLMEWPPDPEDYLEAIETEVKMTPAGPARVHSTLLAADALRTASGEADDAVAKRLDQAARGSTDVRAVVARASRALGKGEVTSPSLRLPDAPEYAPIAAAIDMCLRLRGVAPKDADTTRATPNEFLLRARQALDKADVARAASAVAELASVPELAGGATWLAAALGASRVARRSDSARWLQARVDAGDDEARRALIARAVELGDGKLIAEQIEAPGALSAAERVTLAVLAGVPLAATDPRVEAMTAAGTQALASAVAALAIPSQGEQDREAKLLARAQRTAGSAASRALVRLGRLLASSALPSDVDGTLEALGEARPPGASALALEMAFRAGRALDVSAQLEAWGARRQSPDEKANGALAAALAAEWTGHRERALEAFKAARQADPTCEAALRAVASLEQVDLVAEMNTLADELGEGLPGALARIEAVARGEGLLPEPTRAHLLEAAHRAAPSCPIAAFLAERIARSTGDVEEVLRWVRERRAGAGDPIEVALDAVREALLVADRDPVLASERIHDAYRARPSDIALRELYERMATDPPGDRAAWREQRAAETDGDARIFLLLQAAHEYEHAGDEDGALRCADAAAAGGAALGRIARERAELRTARVGRLADELLSTAKNAPDTNARREAYERLAVLDATGRHDPASALLWHRSILEDFATYKPSLRYLEHHLIGEGRDDELEPIASAIAHALRGTGAGECTAHAELAAQLRMRGAAGSWDATREMVELAAGETEPSLWSLRMLYAHARAHGDDATFLAVTKRLIERSSRHPEMATLLVRAGEAASRLGRLDEGRAFLERATREDPGDVVAWGLLADVRQHSGDGRGAAEACESLARSSLAPEHRLLAWFEAGRIWLDEAKDDDRAVVALEAATAIDVAHEDAFDRLSRLYAARKMQPELAELLERRIGGITNPDERLAMEIRRGRVLLAADDAKGARRAFESALAERPDDPDALSAFTDLCINQGDWDTAEQSLIRLARLLPTPEEQRGVYARLGDLYAHHLLNLSRAEVALNEVLKRAPDDFETAQKLVEVYQRQNDPARAIELQQALIAKARSPEEKRKRMVALAAIYEQTSHDNRRAEQTLEAARREFAQDVGLLRALADFYVRHHQTPAVNILLDRAGADARRALVGGRLSPASFEMLAAVFELRGKKGAALATQAMLAALEARPVELVGAGDRAFDAGLDDLLAPEVLTPAMRTLLAKAGDALDAAAPVDLRALKASAIGADTAIAQMATRVGGAIGLGAVQVLSSPRLGAVCLPVGSNPPTLVVGEALDNNNERTSAFLVHRALKLVRIKASALGRMTPGELAVLVSAWLKCFNPTWQPQGINPGALTAATARVQAALPRHFDPDVGVLALDVAGGIGTRQATIGPSALAWANRVALLALGDPNAALDAIAAAGGSLGGAPRDPKERTTWVTRNPEARDLVAFAVTDAFAEARARLGLER